MYRNNTDRIIFSIPLVVALLSTIKVSLTKSIVIALLCGAGMWIVTWVAIIASCIIITILFGEPDEY